jgi:hypothetical protein
VPHLPAHLPDGVHVEHDGPLLRFTGLGGGGFVGYRDLAGSTETSSTALITRQVRVFAGARRAVRWKLHGH